MTIREILRGHWPRPIILMYHRVATPLSDPWGLAVSPTHFDDQIAALKAERTILTLEDFARLAKAGRLPNDAIAITFDDGYVDNLRVAMPILKRHGAPATFFITTGLLGQVVEFWWDELARLILGSTPNAHQQALYQQTWARLQQLDPASRTNALELLRAQIGGAEPEAGNLPMTYDEVRSLAAEPLATIGAHSVTHPRLSDLDTDALATEVYQSRAVCADLTGKPVNCFAYPFGNVNKATRTVVQEAGFKVACSTEARSTPRRRSDPFALPRIAAPDVGGEDLLRRLRRV